MSEPHWDDHADWWQREFTDGVDPEYVEQIIPLALEFTDGFERVLDVGTGEGQIARAVMAARGGFAVGLDPTRSQVEVGRDRAGGPAYAQSGCEALPIADGSVDAVVVCLVFEHVDDVASAFAEIARVLRPGGYLFLSVPFLFEIHDAPGDFYRFTRHGLDNLLLDFSTRCITARTGYATALLVPLFRLYRSRYALDRSLGLAALALSVPLYPLITLADRLVRSDLATTGYTAVCRK